MILNEKSVTYLLSRVSNSFLIYRIADRNEEKHNIVQDYRG